MKLLIKTLALMLVIMLPSLASAQVKDYFGSMPNLKVSGKNLAEGQVWVAGALHISRQEEAAHDETSYLLSFAPEVGYMLGENWGVGVRAGYYRSKIDRDDAVNKNGSEHFSVAPFVRYSVPQGERLRLFVDGALSYTVDKNTLMGDDQYSYSFGPALRPGLSYQLTSHVGVYSYLGSVGWTHGWADSSTSDSFHFSITSGIGLGLVVWFN